MSPLPAFRTDWREDWMVKELTLFLLNEMSADDANSASCDFKKK